jgi:hypothetical protein
MLKSAWFPQHRNSSMLQALRAVEFILRANYFCESCLGSRSCMTLKKAFTGAAGSHFERMAQHIASGGKGFGPGTRAKFAANPGELTYSSVATPMASEVATSRLTIAK